VPGCAIWTTAETIIACRSEQRLPQPN
jgi:hypothetical protein